MRSLAAPMPQPLWRIYSPVTRCQPASCLSGRAWIKTDEAPELSVIELQENAL
jgi:hypothetical protein